MPKWLSTAGNQFNSWGFPQVQTTCNHYEKSRNYKHNWMLLQVGELQLDAGYCGSQLGVLLPQLRAAQLGAPHQYFFLKYFILLNQTQKKSPNIDQ
jgi:hypothetical protein